MTQTCPSCFYENPTQAQVCEACGDQLPTSSSPTPGSPLHLIAGTSLKSGQYTVEKMLGEGGFGITYTALDKYNNRIVALKELVPERSARIDKKLIWSINISPQERRKLLQQFEQEAQILARCISPYVVQVYEHWNENDTAYIAMDFVQGEPLSQTIKRQGKLPESDVKNIMSQVAQALNCIHKKQLLHRDIKPDNIMIGLNQKCILIDFGNAREYLLSQTSKLTTTGTPEYAPLEQFSSRGRFAPPLDIFSLCASMYEAVTGQVPLPATDRVQGQTLTPPSHLTPEISPLMEKILLTGLSIRSEERFQSAQELLDALQGKFVSPGLRQARQHVRHQNLKQAVVHYQQCLKAEPNNGQAAVELALVSCHTSLEQASQAVEIATHFQPEDGRGHGVLGLIYCQQGRWDEAQAALKKAVQLHPQEAWLWVNLAWAEGNQGHWDEANQSIDQALSLEMNTPWILGMQAWIAAHQQRYKSVIRLARQAIVQSKQQKVPDEQSRPPWLYPYLVLALDYSTTSPLAADVDRAIAEYCQQYRDQGYAYGLAGWRMAQRQQWVDALQKFEQVIHLDNAPTWVLFNAAVVCEHLQQEDRAKQFYQLCLGDSSLAARALNRLGVLAAKAGDLQDASNYLTQASQQCPECAEIFHNLGWVLLRQKQKDNRLNLYRDIVEAYTRAVKLYIQQGKSAIATQLKQSFLSTGIQI